MLAIAHGYAVVFIEDIDAVRVVGSQLQVGHLASPDLIATIACRRSLERQGISGELALAEKVAALGYAYEPEPWLAHAC
jgi:hypothetical protein